MNKNKGIIGVGLIIAIVLGIVVVGGGAYYFGVKKNIKIVENNSHEVPAGPYGTEADYVAPTPITTACTSTSVPSIKVLSPNGGETYTAGQKITVKWSSCNIEANQNVSIDIERMMNANDVGDPVVDFLGKTLNDQIETFIVPDDVGVGKFSLTITTDNLAQTDSSNNSFTINSETTIANLKTYTNKEYGIEFQYPSTLTVAENQWPARSGSYDSGYSIAVSVPFKTHYDAWTSKGIDITIHKSSCGDYLPTSLSQKKTINGIDYIFEDPEWGATSGMSSISKWRKYFYESSGNCYIIDEGLRGLGNNERPSTYTFPTDVNKFLDEEMLDLDKIMASVKIY